MPNRIIKESICYSDDLDRLTSFEETVFYRLLVRVDDYGRIDARPTFLRSMLFVTKKGITDKNIEEAVARLASLGLVKFYEVDEKSFLMFPKWHLHQRVRDSKEKYPAPPTDDISPQVAASRGESRPESQSQSVSKSLSEDGGRARRFTPPSCEEVAAYCRERKNCVDAERFVNFYASKGWVVGKSAMKDWKAAVRNWEHDGGSAGSTVRRGKGSADGRTQDERDAAAREELDELRFCLGRTAGK